MKKVASIWGCLIAICIVYFLFFNSGEDAVKKVSFRDIIFINMLTRMDSKDLIQRKTDIVEKLVSGYKKETGIDLSMPIYKVLKGFEGVKNVEVINRLSSEGNYNISYTYQGKSFKIPFLVKESEFKSFTLAKAICLYNLDDALEKLSKFYKIPEVDIRQLKRLNLPISNN